MGNPAAEEKDARPWYKEDATNGVSTGLGGDRIWCWSQDKVNRELARLLELSCEHDRDVYASMVPGGRFEACREVRQRYCEHLTRTWAAESTHTALLLLCKFISSQRHKPWLTSPEPSNNHLT